MTADRVAAEAAEACDSMRQFAQPLEIVGLLDAVVDRLAERKVAALRAASEGQRRRATDQDTR